jgi:hypothetical protein
MRFGPMNVPDGALPVRILRPPAVVRVASAQLLLDGWRVTIDPGSADSPWDQNVQFAV